MAKFKILYKYDITKDRANALWEPGCPAIISAIQISRNTENGKCYFQLKLQNVSGARIDAISVRANIEYADGSNENHEINLLDADVSPGDYCLPKAIELAASEPVRADVTIASVKQGSKAWAMKGDRASLPLGDMLKLSAESESARNDFFRKKDKDPSIFQRKVIDQDGWWVCSCGNVNVERVACHYCKIKRETMLRLQDESYLQAEGAKKKSKRKRTIAISAVVAVVLLAALVVVFPYLAGFVQLYSGDYENAYGSFSQREWLLNSSEMAKESAKAEADSLRDAGMNTESAEWYERAGRSDIANRMEIEAKHENDTEERLKNDPLLKLLVGHLLRATAVTDYGSFGEECFDNGKYNAILLGSGGEASVVHYVGDSEFKYNGEWGVEENFLFYVDIPEYHGRWTASKTIKDNEFLLVNDDDDKLQLLFNADEENFVE